jgi:hypothetical protein
MQGGPGSKKLQTKNQSKAFADVSRVQMLHGAVFSKRAPLAAGGKN